MYARVAPLEPIGSLESSHGDAMLLGYLGECITTSHLISPVASLGRFALVRGGWGLLDFFLRFGYLLRELLLMVTS